MHESLEKLTWALQELERRRREGDKPVDLPREISIRELVFSKEVSEFLEKSRTYSEKTCDVNVGRY